MPVIPKRKTGPSPRLTPEVEAILIDDYRAKREKVIDLARRFKVSRATVYNIVARHNKKAEAEARGAKNG